MDPLYPDLLAPLMHVAYEPYDYFEDRIQHHLYEHRRRVINQVDIRFNLRDRNNPFDISVPEFRKVYRMPQDIFMELVRILAPFCPVRFNHAAVPLQIRVLCAVAFYACGSYQRVCGGMADLSISQSSVCNFIKEVTDALNNPQFMSRFVHFPETNEERQQACEKNARLGLPRVLGLVDGTLVKIVPPKMVNNKEAYYTRKGFTGINVQLVCDADLIILAVDARFPGSCNDKYIFRNSGLRDEMVVAYREYRCWLLGDSGYMHEPWMQLPFPGAPIGTPAYRYTKAHCMARNAVERCIGVLKAIWRCLLCDRTLHYSPEKAGLIINACVILYNFLRSHKVPYPRPVNLARDQGGDLYDGIPDVDPNNAQNVRLLAQEELQYLVNYVANRP